jgi:hypothetical protein
LGISRLPSEETESIRSPRVVGAIWLGRISFFCWAQDEKITASNATSVIAGTNLFLISGLSIIML